MDAWNGLLFGSMAIVVSVWAVISGMVVFLGIVHAQQRHRRGALARRVRDVKNEHVTPEERSAALQHIVRDLQQSAADRAVIAASRDPLLTEAIARHELERRGAAGLVADARARRGRKWKRITALVVLPHVEHPEALDALRAALDDPDPDVVQAAVSALGRTPDRRAAEALVQLMCSGKYPAARAAAVLDAFPLPIADLLCGLTAHELASARFWGTTLLARYGCADDVEASLCLASFDEDPRVRKAAIEALGKMRSPELERIGTKLLEDRIFYVRAHAIRALATVGDPDLATAIAPALGDESWWVRLAARESLTAMGPAVARAVRSYLDSTDEAARTGAAEVLRDVGLGLQPTTAARALEMAGA